MKGLTDDTFCLCFNYFFFCLREFPSGWHHFETSTCTVVVQRPTAAKAAVSEYNLLS